MSVERKVLRTTLRDQVYQRLLSMILTNELPSGTRLNEGELSKMLGVSITPVREALNKLRGDGLVMTDPWQGSFVRSFSDEDIKNILDIRTALETLAVQQTFPNLTKQDLEVLEGIQRSYEEQYSVVPPDLEKVAMWNASFHGYFVEKTANPWLAQILESLNTHIALVKAPITRSSDGKASIREHREILQALRDGDLDRAVKWVHIHIQRMRSDLLELRKSSGPASRAY